MHEQQNQHNGHTVVLRWRYICLETISYHPMHLQSASQLENWVWYLYIHIPSYSKIVTCSRPSRKERACLLLRFMVHNWYRESGMDGSKTSGVFPVSLKRRSCLPSARRWVVCLSNCSPGGKRMRYESNLDCADAGSACKKMARRQSQGRCVSVVASYCSVLL